MGWETNKVLLNSKLGLTRMAQHRQKLEFTISTSQSEIISELRRNSFDSAMHKMEVLMTNRRDLQMMDVVQSAYRQLTQNLQLIAQSKKCPQELALALGVVIWSADRLGVPEFGVVRDMIYFKFGLQKNILSKLPNGGSGAGESAHLAGIVIPQQVVDAFSVIPGADRNAVLEELASIAKNNGIPFAMPSNPISHPPLPPQPIQHEQPQIQHNSNSNSNTNNQKPLPITTTTSHQHNNDPFPQVPNVVVAAPTPVHHQEHQSEQSSNNNSNNNNPPQSAISSSSPPLASPKSDQQTETRQKSPGTSGGSSNSSGGNKQSPFHLVSKSSFLNVLSKLSPNIDHSHSPNESSTTSTSSTTNDNNSNSSNVSAATTEVEVKDLPIKIEPNQLTFGLGSRQAPVDEDVCETFTISNFTRDKWNYSFTHSSEVINNDRCLITFEPNKEGNIHAGKSVQVIVRLKVFYTTKFRIDLGFCVWKSSSILLSNDQSHNERIKTTLRALIESQLTTKLDKDELHFGNTIGDGAYGIVYQGEFRGLPVAIKVLKHQEDITTELLGDFKGEIRMFEKLRHPVIINFIGAVHTRGHLAIVSEFAPYGSLYSAMKKHHFSQELKLKCLLDCASGVDFLHQSGIIHRDLKPDNLLLVSLEPKSSVVCKLSDFGTTRDVNTSSAAMSSTRGIGTPLFMAPEVLDGESYEMAADVYAFALIMNIVFSEVLPFSDENIAGRPWEFAAQVRNGKRPKIPESCPVECKEMMTVCWSPKKEERPTFNVIHKQLVAIFAKYAS